MHLNADLGESWKSRTVGNDQGLMPLLDSCNIACGFHGGDAVTMLKTIDLALANDVAIGAHPSFPDRKHFGRRHMELSAEELAALVLYQVSALQGMAKARGADLHHVKAHGALYHHLNKDEAAATAFVRVVRQLGIPRIYGPPKGALRRTVEALTAAQDSNPALQFWSEGFADRRYELVTDGSAGGASLRLRSRTYPDATLEDTQEVIRQVRQMMEQQTVTTVDGSTHPLRVDTVCVHGDHPGAVARAAALRAAFGGNR